jgi:hypothetical protein
MILMGLKLIFSGTKKGRNDMDPKPITKSVTAWGAVIAGVGGIAALIGNALSQNVPIDWGTLLPQVIAVVGAVVAAVGARRAVGNIGR